MALSTDLKDLVNRCLRPFNLRLETRTLDRLEDDRLRNLAQAGHFDGPAFPIPPGFADCDPQPVFEALAAHAGRLADLASGERNPVGYSFDNGYFTSPDAEVLYCMVRMHQPGRIVEVGSGHSTKIARLAIRDGRLPTVLTAIDPQPRVDVASFADAVHAARVESPEGRRALGELGRGDVLFIDSSHEVRAGNDVVTLLLNVVPQLPGGVIVHVHDVFLPYEYPADWIVRERWQWNEQYLLQALLDGTSRLDVLWAGHYLQRTLPSFAGHFPLGSRQASSLWLRTRDRDDSGQAGSGA